MELQSSRSNRLLLVEDDCGDARAVEICLRDAASERYELVLATTLEQAVAILGRGETDIVLLDLTLPDSSGLDTLIRFHAVAMGVPIVVLTGLDDDGLALRCIEAGAQDYLCKSNITPNNLRRALGYALSRVREGRLQALRIMLQSWQALSSEQMSTQVTRAIAGIGPIKVRIPDIFNELQTVYHELLEEYMEHLLVKKEKPRDAMEALATRLGDLGATPRDLIDVHMSALDIASRSLNQSRIASFASDGRLFALEIMGLLVEYYRLGFRRLFPKRAV
jgi:DNA-binding response OmpR family regulator